MFHTIATIALALSAAAFWTVVIVASAQVWREYRSHEATLKTLRARAESVPIDPADNSSSFQFKPRVIHNPNEN